MSMYMLKFEKYKQSSRLNLSNIFRENKQFVN